MTATLKLFRESLTCKSCGHKWSGFLHGFSRGHTVLEKEGRVLFIPDDICYAFLSDYDGDYPQLFLESGWRELESCPHCRSKDFTGWQYDQSATEDVACVFIDEHDLARKEKRWVLTETGRLKIS